MALPPNGQQYLELRKAIVQRFAVTRFDRVDFAQKLDKLEGLILDRARSHLEMDILRVFIPRLRERVAAETFPALVRELAEHALERAITEAELAVLLEQAAPEAADTEAAR